MSDLIWRTIAATPDLVQNGVRGALDVGTERLVVVCLFLGDAVAEGEVGVRVLDHQCGRHYRSFVMGGIMTTPLWRWNY